MKRRSLLQFGLLGASDSGLARLAYSRPSHLELTDDQGLVSNGNPAEYARLDGAATTEQGEKPDSALELENAAENRAEPVRPAPYGYINREKQADGFRSIMEWIDAPHRTDIRNGYSTRDLTAEVDSALASGEDVDLGIGRFNITDSPKFSRPAQRLRGRDRETTVIKVGPDFNMAQTAVIHGVPYGEVSDISIDFEQPASVTNKAHLVHYPYAFTAQAAQRSQWRRIGWKRAWGGFHAIGIDGANNPTGIIIEDVKDGSFHYSLRMSGAFDFVSIDKWHAWEFGFSGTRLAKIAYEDPGIFEIGHVETLSCGILQMWMKRIDINDHSLFKRTISNLKLDGWSSRLNLVTGNTQIGLLDICCDNNTADGLVTQMGGHTTISNVDFKTPNLKSVPLLNVSGGHLKISSGFMDTHPLQQLGLVSGGVLEIGSVRALGGTNTARPRPFWQQSGPSGRLILDGTEAPPKGSGSGVFASIATDESHRIRADFQGWSLFSPTAYSNNFEGSINLGSDY